MASPGAPVAAGGATLAEAHAVTVETLRDYADDWLDYLHRAPNHQPMWPLIVLVTLSSDDELTASLGLGAREVLQAVTSGDRRKVCASP